MNQASRRHPRRNLLIGLLAALAPLALHAASDQPWGQGQGQTGSSPSAPSSPSSPSSTPSLPPESSDTGSGSGRFDRESTPSNDSRGVQGPIRSDTEQSEQPDSQQSPSGQLPSDQSPESMRETQRRQNFDDMIRRQEEERQRALPNR